MLWLLILIHRPIGRLSEGMHPGIGEGPYVRGKALWLLWRAKVTRRRADPYSAITAATDMPTKRCQAPTADLIVKIP